MCVNLVMVRKPCASATGSVKALLVKLGRVRNATKRDARAHAVDAAARHRPQHDRASAEAFAARAAGLARAIRLDVQYALAGEAAFHFFADAGDGAQRQVGRGTAAKSDSFPLV